jgi:hypothetical protein
VIYEPVLTDKNFVLYCAHNYKNPSCNGTSEFYDDIRRIKYIKKLVTRYIETGELKERLILNHIIVLSNVFMPESLCRILFLKMEHQFPYIKPFLVTTGYLTRYINNVKETRVVDTNVIPMDPRIIEALRSFLPNRVE